MTNVVPGRLAISHETPRPRGPMLSGTIRQAARLLVIAVLTGGCNDGSEVEPVPVTPESAELEAPLEEHKPVKSAAIPTWKMSANGLVIDKALPKGYSKEDYKEHGRAFKEKVLADPSVLTYTPASSKEGNGEQWIDFVKKVWDLAKSVDPTYQQTFGVPKKADISKHMAALNRTLIPSGLYLVAKKDQQGIIQVNIYPVIGTTGLDVKIGEEEMKSGVLHIGEGLLGDENLFLNKDLEDAFFAPDYELNLMLASGPVLKQHGLKYEDTGNYVTHELTHLVLNKHFPLSCAEDQLRFTGHIKVNDRRVEVTGKYIVEVDEWVANSAHLAHDANINLFVIMMEEGHRIHNHQAGQFPTYSLGAYMLYTGFVSDSGIPEELKEILQEEHIDRDKLVQYFMDNRAEMTEEVKRVAKRSYDLGFTLMGANEALVAAAASPSSPN